MNIIEYIKQKLGIGKKRKLLMEQNPQTIEEKITVNDNKKTMLDKYKVEKTPKIYKKGTIEYAIEQYITNVLYSYEKMDIITLIIH